MFGTEKIGAAIKAARQKNGYTQEALAERLGVTPTHIKHIESGRRMPSVEILFLAARELHFSVDQLIGSGDAKDPAPTLLDGFLQACTKKELRLLEAVAEAILKSR
ncbi:MAG: helix-turn-helix transcriptional regulator [Clostridia bacterium]|nr:helix-turn-helix transcriptional regulator [Clostridia bacterium]